MQKLLDKNSKFTVKETASKLNPLDMNTGGIVAQATLQSICTSGLSGEGDINLATTLNRAVEGFCQGGLNDCWYLASIKSLSMSTLGQQYIYNSINFDSTNASLSLAGTAGYTYHTTLDELTLEINDGDTSKYDGHSSGDADTLLFEMAIKDYFYNSDYKNSNFYSSPYEGGSTSEALSLITGKLVTTYNNSNHSLSEISAKLNELAGIISHAAITVSFSQVNLSLDIPAVKHSYSIIAIDTINKMVSFRNPWYTETALKQISYADFSSYCNSIDYVDLSSNNQCIFGSNIGGTINSGIGNDSLYGGTGDDIINGGAGIDMMIGGAGNDTFYVDNDGDYVVENANEGIDTVISSVSYTLGGDVENLTLTGTTNINATGNGLDNIITGNSANNNLSGGDGNDSLYGGDGLDTLVGGTGDDVLEGGIGADSLIGGSGYDNLYGGSGADILRGGADGDNLYGGDGADSLFGDAGCDMLDGGIGADTMAGGLDSDIYYVDNINDVIVENANEGNDAVYSSVSYTLGNNVEQLVLTGTGIINGTGNTLNNYIGGNVADNMLTGGAGNDTLFGNEGKDTLKGGTGDDFYEIGWDGLNDDIIIENANEGIDTVISSISYTLGNNVENLIFDPMGWQDINGTGNSLNNSIIGNSGNNILDGKAGNDTLDGGVGIDTMIGGTGNDTYYVDDYNDVITENSNEGTDTVMSSTWYTLSNNVENLTLVGTESISGTGNNLNNVITGNSGSNFIDGGAGADTMKGGLGDDMYFVDIAGDVVVENANEGNDMVYSSVSYTLGNNLETLILMSDSAINGTGNALDNQIYGSAANNLLTGGAGNDTLDGGYGVDTMIGGTGNDTYYVDNISDVITENANEGTDTVIYYIDNNTYTLGNNIENLMLWGFNSYGLGNSLNNVITGNWSNNAIDGYYGADTMIGGGGDDIYYVDNIGDVVIENADEGTDKVVSSIAYTLGANVENLTLTGSAAINGTGNALDNYIIGNYSNNILTGGAGNDTIYGYSGTDTMIGGTGNDTYYVDSSGDVVTENASEGTDTVKSYITYTLGANVENLTLFDTVVGINGTGNTLNNYIIGNSIANTLTGGAGNDTLNGGAGNDILKGDADNDTYLFDAGAGNDIVSDSAGFDIISLGSNVLKQSVAFFQQGVDLVLGYSNGDRITVQGQSNAGTNIERFELSSGEFLTDTNINSLIQQMSSYAVANGIQLNSVNDVLANQNLMTMVSNSWHG